MKKDNFDFDAFMAAVAEKEQYSDIHLLEDKIIGIIYMNAEEEAVTAYLTPSQYMALAVDGVDVIAASIFTREY